MTKTILITGASRGIGRAAAILAGQKGWSVGVNYVGNKAAADEVVAAIIAAGGKAKAIQGDVANEADVIAMFRQTEELGPLDGLVINAGIVAPASKLMDIDTERLKRMFDVNILGAYVCAREGVRRMARSRGGKGGSIVILSSAAARLGGPSEYVDYAGSKGAMDTLTIGLSKEVGAEGIRVNAVRPGLIETDIHASGGQPDRAQRLGVMAPLGRPGTADEVGESIVWLLSDAASYVTGALLDVTGGR
ncbi:NAD(P)-dependent dehydrogenase (short-subunit alcohol dehydrogenase family) [Phyllobacterium myrsinacearum]|uniref:SDR family oxidoreductase n=1 Tax=Phyllobacterium myrsinacearum TaxID=28101 RepID=UPI001028EDEA|nr:SDR family oxidoreductase [Phyllobacterium myrsinacearum]RZS88162.1 NAD(P)-dependent dehydrogenase (short-subunit alcohol dehydrogenase family) [Phyllobacterium myrsinacearum]